MSAELGKPRGVLRPQLERGQFQHARRAPSAPLANLVEHYWYVRWDLRELPPQQQTTLPHPNVHLVVENGESNIYGVHTERFERRLEGQNFAFGIKFKPGGFHPFLQSPISTLANRAVSTRAVFGSSGLALAPRIAACADVDAMTAAAEAFLFAHLPPPDPNVARASMLVAAIAGDLGMTSVDRLMTTAAMDRRALQRLFQKYVGIGPKWVIKRYRLHEAIAQVQDRPHVNWAALALELGYFDQAHFIRDFRALVGQSPAEYARSLTTIQNRSNASGNDGLAPWNP
jgi:AraC-like DNA-binding protein